MSDPDSEPSGRLRVLRVYHSGVVRSWRAREHALRDLGVDVTLVSPQRWNEGGADVHLGDDHEDWVVPVHTFGRHPYGFVYRWRPLRRLLRANRFDVLDVHEEPASLAALQVRMVARLTGHGRTPMLLYGAQNLEKRFPFPFRSIERGSLRRAAATYPCNHEAGAIFVRKGFQGIVHTLPLGIPLHSFTPAPFTASRDDGSFRVGYVGRLEPHKGLHVVLEAMRLLPNDVTLEVVGDGSQRMKLEQSVATHDLLHRVQFVGHLPQHETNERYRTYDVLVVPSQTRPNWVEQFGRVVVEAMASGTPVIVSDSGSLPEVAGDAGLVMPEGDAQAWASAIHHLRDDPEARRMLRENGLRRAVQFDWRQVAAAQVALYRQVLA